MSQKRRNRTLIPPIQLKHTSKNRMTAELCAEAVKRDVRNFRYVPDVHKAQVLCDVAVYENGAYLKFVPEELKKPKLCREAVRQNGDNLAYVPEALRTPGLCEQAAQKNLHNFKHVPESFKTPELCAKAVELDGNNLQFVSDGFKTPELCAKAVEFNGDNLQFVPDGLKTRELCLEAIINRPRSVAYVPSHIALPADDPRLSEQTKRYLFCKAKYGSGYPKDIGFGRIEWWNVPYFAMGTVGGGLKSIPIISSGENQQSRELTRDELSQLGINFDPYNHKEKNSHVAEA
jgi:hypothetical protein